ncbi:MAG: copper homeostasis protein CutC [Bacteroidales bacterium]|jgi:copper homeostasis protein|nr:copper homeostasis protein CutC [Bacteroidales bacterium]
MEKKSAAEYVYSLILQIMIEVCVDNIQSALTAQSSGAGRVELCSGLTEGGVTPSAALIRLARKKLTIRLHVIIRPRGGDFLYDDDEFEMMKQDIVLCGETGCDGVVTGILRADGSVDTERCSKLVQIARRYAMSVTFHRAFDRSNELFSALKDVIAIGCDRILTSGGCDTACEGADVIRQLIEKAANRIVIMPGSGITSENAEYLIKKTGLKELHGTFRKRVEGGMKYRNTRLSASDEEYNHLLTDADAVRKVNKLISNCLKLHSFHIGKISTFATDF